MGLLAAGLGIHPAGGGDSFSNSLCLGNIASSVSASMTQILRWAYWWNSTEALPDDVSDGQIVVELNTNFLGHNANAVRWQIWTALLVYLLLCFCAFLSQGNTV